MGLRQLAVGDRWSSAFTSLAPPPWIDAAVKAPAVLPASDGQPLPPRIDAAPAVLPSPAATGLHLSSAPPKSDDASPPRRKATKVYQVPSSTDSSDDEYVARKRSALRKSAVSNKAATSAPAVC